jgi:putative heme-binding domain-containing protein
VPDALVRLKSLAADEHPRVRLEAVRAASFFRTAEAIEVALISAERPSDYFLDYCRGETMRVLEPYWRKAVADGRAIPFSSEAGARFFLKNLSVSELVKLPRSRGVDLEILLRVGAPAEARGSALARLAAESGESRSKALLGILRGRVSASGDMGIDPGVMVELSKLLADRDREDLRSIRGELETILREGSARSLRELAIAAMVMADGSIEPAWKLASGSIGSMRDFLSASTLLRSDPDVVAELYPRVMSLMDGLPPDLARVGGSRGVLGRYVRIELKGRRTLTLAEVEVDSDGENVALRGRASQKNTAHGAVANRAIDGNASAAFTDGGQTHTEENTLDPWWELDLGSEMPIDAVTVHNRGDGELGRRLEGFHLRILDERRSLVFEREGNPAPRPKGRIETNGERIDSQLRRFAMTALASMPGHEAETVGVVSRIAMAGADRDAAIRSLLRIPVGKWPKDVAKPLLESLIGYVRAIPAAERTELRAMEALQLGDMVAGLLPPGEARPLRKELSSLGTRVLRLGTVIEQMRYDVDVLAAGAGKEVELIFENTDLMPHNFVLTKPGSLEEIGMLAEASATDPKALERQYIPSSDKILVSSRLVQPREAERIRFVAPTSPGIYPYVCTYPGHWRRMYGAFYVVEDLEEYLSDPSGYLAAHPLTVSDKLLELNRPRTDWTYDELSGGLASFTKGRSFAAGRQLFQSASCVSCHKMNGVGVQIGADLATLDPKKATPEHILKSLLDPSAEIDEKYRSTVIGTADGQVVTGLIIEDRFDQVKLIENPLATAEPKVISKKEITERAVSPVSIMPRGLLDRLTREEILDLVAYVLSRGDSKHAVYADGHGGHGH